MDSNLPSPPYKRRALVDAVAARSQFQPTALVSAGVEYTTTVFFGPTGPEGSHAVASTLAIPAPVAGATPAALIRDSGLVGKVVWRTLKPGSNKIDGPVAGTFQAGAAYVAQVSWTPEAAPKAHSEPVLQMPQGAYRSGVQGDGVSNGVNRVASGITRTAATSANEPTQKVVPNTNASTNTNINTNTSGSTVSVSSRAGPAGQVSALTAPAVSVMPNQAPVPGGQINLPDLGGEPEPVAPSKKPTQDALAGQNYRSGGQVGSSGSPGASWSGSGSSMPGANAGQGANDLGLPPGAVPTRTPGANTASAMLPAVNLGDAGAGASIGATGAKFHTESKNYLAQIGLDYVSPKSSYGIGVKADGAALLSDTLALGTNLTFNNINEAVLNAVWLPKDLPIKTKLSAAYMWGQQNFDFYSGNAPASLTQASYYFSSQYVVPKEQSDYVHSVGASTWGSRANQTNNPTPVYTTVETASAYNIMMDPRKWALGQLQGEALDLQAGLSKQVIGKASLGYESLKFPFSDGSQELNKRIYQDYVVQYQPIPEVALQAGYKLGAAMNNIMLSAAYSSWKLTAFKNNGQNGITGNQGMALTYSIPLDGKPGAPTFGTLVRPELVGNSAYVLRDAAIRPVQLPQAFLAKVDQTAVIQAASISKTGLGPGTSVNQAGDVLVNVGTGGGTITGVTRNGTPFTYASSISSTATGLQIKTLALPAAASSGDTYVVSMTDNNSTPYFVNFTTAN